MGFNLNNDNYECFSDIELLLLKFSKYIHFTNKKCVYNTAVFGDYDVLKKPRISIYLGILKIYL